MNAKTSTTPPKVSPSRWAFSISVIICSLVTLSAQRTGSSSITVISPACGNGESSATRTEPIERTWLRIVIPTLCCKKFRATAPSATRAAVSRALARSKIARASSKSYFCIPTKSACPGRGRVNGALRPKSLISSSGTGSADITFSHFGHSELPT